MELSAQTGQFYRGTLKRGDTLDLLKGVSVNVNDENNDDYKLTVEEITSNGKAVTIEEDENDTDDSSQNGATTEDKNKFTKLKEGTYTVKYTATNSWGAITTVDRVITVEPRTDLEKVKLTVKDINNNKYYYISNNTKSYNVYISKIYDYNEEDMLVFNPMEYNIDIEKFLDIINNVKFKENKDADYYIIQK